MGRYAKSLEDNFQISGNSAPRGSSRMFYSFDDPAEEDEEEEVEIRGRDKVTAMKPLGNW
jgi:hypothetical protein